MTSLANIAQQDVNVIDKKNAEYGESWKRRGGVGAFMMLARKWDRLEVAAQRAGWDIFTAATGDAREEGILDDIGDLRRYLLLVEGHIRASMEETAATLVVPPQPGVRARRSEDNPRGFRPDEEL